MMMVVVGGLSVCGGVRGGGVLRGVREEKEEGP